MISYRRVWRVVCDSSTPDMSGRPRPLQLMSELDAPGQALLAIQRYKAMPHHRDDNVRLQTRLVSEWEDE